MIANVPAGVNETGESRSALKVSVGLKRVYRALAGCVRA
jgi:hypothetical protein